MSGWGPWVIVAEDSTEWWWLSFADGHLPEGSQFLGAAIVAGAGMVDAVREAHRLRVNPGGEVAGHSIRSAKVPHEHWRNRLLSRDEIAVGEARGWGAPASI